MTPPIDWTTFTRKIYIKATVQAVYDAWTTPEQIEHWFLEQADFSEPGGAVRAKADKGQPGDGYAWKWHNWDKVQEGRLLEANGHNRVVFSFAGEGNVTLVLEDGAGLPSKREGYTRLTLTQDSCPQDEEGRYNVFYGCSLGWSFWMVNLKAWLEHGIVLNDVALGSENSPQFANS